MSDNGESGGEGAGREESGGGHNPSYRLRRPGGEVDKSRIVNAPGIVLVIAGAIVAAFAFMAFAPERTARLTQEAAGLVPAAFASGPEANGGVLAMAAPLVTHMFVHAGLAHLLMNTLFLLAFGTPVARRMNADGALQSSAAFAAASMFLTFYLLCGAVGALAFIALHADEYTLLVGASGGVFGLLGGLVRFAFNRTTLFGPEDARFNGLTARPVIGWTMFVVLTNNPVAAALLSPMAGGGGIAWEAHMGGYFFGLLTYPFFERAARGFR